MELKQLAMLVTIVDCGGYAQAGKALNISHSAIHRQIKLLEEEIKEYVVIRTGQRVELTEAGRILLNLGRRMHREISDTRRELNEITHSLAGRLNIGTGSSILVSFLPPILQQFRQEFPGVEVYLMTGTGDGVMHDIATGTLDLGVVFDPADTVSGGQGTTHEILYKEEFLWAVGKRHALAHRRCVTLAEVARHPLIMLPKTSHVRRTCERLFESAALKPRIAVDVENEEAIDKLVEVDIGVALRSRHRSQNNNIQMLRTSALRIYSEVGLVFPTGAYIPKTVREFARLCRQAAAVLQNR
jgi:DNA-binding transcriptional LysR family regulator